MPHHASILLLTQCFLLLLAAVLGGGFARRLRLPPVVGELAAGVALGPTFFGALAPALFARLFPPAAAEPLVAAGRDAILGLGMLFFLFTAGREVRLSAVRARARAVTATSLAGILLPFALGVATVYLLPGLFGDGGASPTLALFLGTALAISALPVIARILLDLDLLRRPLGATTLAAATLDDLAGWTLFAALLAAVRTGPDVASARGPWPALGAAAGALVGVALLLGFARPLLQRHVLPRLGSVPARIGAAALATLLLAALAEAAGLHPVFGAFIAGTLFAREESAEAEEEEPTTAANGTPHDDPIGALALGFFAPLYFASVGLKADFAKSFDPALVLVVLAVACVGKIVGAGAGAWLGGLKQREALAVGFAMNARGAMEILLASVAREAGLIDDRLFVALVVMALVTSLMTGPALRHLTD